MVGRMWLAGTPLHPHTTLNELMTHSVPNGSMTNKMATIINTNILQHSLSFMTKFPGRSLIGLSYNKLMKFHVMFEYTGNLVQLLREIFWIAGLWALPQILITWHKSSKKESTHLLQKRRQPTHLSLESRQTLNSSTTNIHSTDKIKP